MIVTHDKHNAPEFESCRLSVVIPCYNDGFYLPQAVESVLSQGVPGVELEILVIDDHSSDPYTLEVFSRLETANREVHILHNTGIRGPAAARNIGIKAARGEWIAFLDSDDIWLSGGLLARWQATKDIPNAEWIGADFVYWYKDGTCDQMGYFKTNSITGRSVCSAYHSGRPQRFVRPVHEFLTCLLTWTSTTLVKKCLLERVGGFDERLKGPEDFHLWIRLARVSDFYFVPVIAAKYRQHDKSLMNGRGNIHFCRRREAVNLLLLDPAFSPYRGAIRDNLTFFHRDIAYGHLADGEKWLAVHHAVMAVLRKPFWVSGWKTLLHIILRLKQEMLRSQATDSCNSC
jgi:glycosyltransferase involved in cell wall biosynthesis